MTIETNNEAKNEIALEGLYFVLDPEIDLNIVDLGLVYKIEFKEDSKDILVTMTLTSQFCPMGESIVAATTQSMQQSFPESNIQVELVFDPPWNHGMISPEGNVHLNS